MYLDYFSLKRHPFRITPDPSLFVAGGARGRGVVLDALVYGITSGEGILKVVGEVGSGKTMLCRMLEERLPPSIEIVYLANPSLSARDIVFAIAIELKLEADAATDRLLVLHRLQEYLLRKHAEGGSVVVFIEEAQSMPLETLEEVRLLSNLETHRHKLMQIVLFGQPELDRKLEQKSIRQLRERITHSFNLAPLSPGEVREYLHFRLQAAGCPWPQLFSSRAELLLAKASGGLSRRINILADKSLLAAYADPTTRPDARNSAGEKLPVVYPRHVRTAIADSSFRSLGQDGVLRWAGYAAAALGGAALVALALWLLPDAATTEFPAAAPAVTEAAVTGTVATEVVVTEAAVTEAAVTEAVAPEAVTAAGADPAVAGTEAAAAAITTTAVAKPEPEAPASAVATATALADPAEGPAAVPASAADPAIAGPAAAEPSVTAVSTATYTPAMVAGTSLASRRQQASREWLQTLASKAGYSVQLISVATDNNNRLEEILEFLDLSGLLESTYLCLISGNAQREQQWLVLHGEFAGLSEARRFIEALPPYIGQHGAYARNMSGIACANGGRDSSDNR